MLMLADTAVVDPAPLFILPFVGLLLAIALLPVFLKHHWEQHYHTISTSLGAITVVYYVFGLKAGGEMLHVASEYISFMALIGSLFVISGGIQIRVSREAKPWVNSLFLLGGHCLEPDGESHRRTLKCPYTKLFRLCNKIFTADPRSNFLPCGVAIFHGVKTTVTNIKNSNQWIGWMVRAARLQPRSAAALSQCRYRR